MKSTFSGRLWGAAGDVGDRYTTCQGTDWLYSVFITGKVYELHACCWS
jgi:hypothetical protein